MQEIEEEMEVVTLYTLAPKGLDKPGTVDVGGYWLYSDEQVPEQVLREVLVDKSQSTVQLQAYTLKTPYITFTEVGLQKALVKGTVYRADNGTNGVAFDPIKAAIELSNNQKEDTTMAKKVKTPIVTPQVPTTDRTPRGMAPQAPAVHIMTQAPVGVPVELLPKAKVSALDAILAAPIVPAVIPPDSPEGRESAALAALAKKTLPLPEEKTKEESVAALSPEAWLRERLTIMQGTIENLYADVHAMRAQYTPEHVYDWLEQALKAAMPFSGMPQGCGEDTPAVAPVPVDPIGDAWGSMMDEHKTPVKPQSTFVLGPNVGKAPRTPVQDIPESHGKVPVETIKAIQAAWKKGGVTQAQLAQKYGINEKAAWYFIHRAKQYV